MKAADRQKIDTEGNIKNLEKKVESLDQEKSSLLMELQVWLKGKHHACCSQLSMSVFKYLFIFSRIRNELKKTQFNYIDCLHLFWFLASNNFSDFFLSLCLYHYSLSYKGYIVTMEKC